MSKTPIALACAFVWGTVAGVSLAIVAAGNAQTMTASSDGIGTLHLDGVPVATFTGLNYDFATEDLHLTTEEIVLDCLTDRIFHDDFEPGGAQ